MPDKEGQLAPEPIEPQAPDKGTPEPIPELEKFKGKSADDVARAYAELEKKLGEQSSELGRLREDNAQFVNYLTQVAAQQQPQRPDAQPAPENAVREFFDKPLETVDARVDKKLVDFYRAIRTEQATTTSQFAKSMAATKYPHLFQGDLGKETDRFMQQAIKSGVVHPSVVENPEMWASIAYILQGQKSGFSIPGQVNPVSPQTGERPAGTRTRADEDEGEPLELDRVHEEAIRGMGFKPDELKKEMREDKKKERRGAR